MDNYIKKLESELINNVPEAAVFINDLSQSTAERAFMNTSFSPEKRGANVRIEYVECLLQDKSMALDEISKASKRGAEVRQDFDVLIEEWFKSHREKLRECYNSWLHSHSRVASSFIVGPANFPLARNQKLSGYADAKLTAIAEFRTKSIKNIIKLILPYGDGSAIQSDDPNACDKIENKIHTLEQQRDQMKTINKLVRAYFKKGNPEVSPGELAEFKNKLRTEFHVDEMEIVYLLKPDYSGKIVGFKKWEFQNLSANINRYKKRMGEVEKTNTLSIDHEFSNGIKVTLSDDQKICIHFGFKPCEDIRSLLKASAFKFSRHRDNAWVRKFTLNAAFSYNQFIKPRLAAL